MCVYIILHIYNIKYSVFQLSTTRSRHSYSYAGHTGHY